MSTLSKVLLGLVFLASLGFLWAASRAVMTWDAYRSAYNAHVARVEQVEQVARSLLSFSSRASCHAARRQPSRFHARR